MKGIVRGPAVPWVKIVVRPVRIKNKHHVQISHFDARKDTTKNYYGDLVLTAIREVVAIPFSAIHLETTRRYTDSDHQKGQSFRSTQDQAQPSRA